MSINLELYRVFITVAENHSFTGAARELYLTQSAVSQSVRQLEDALGVRLFTRGPKGVALTEPGESLYSRIDRILEEVKGAERYFSQLKNLELGTLKIGASDTLCRHMLLPALKKFHEIFPSIEIQVTNRTSGETTELVIGGKADIGFVNLPVAGMERLNTENIALVHDCFIYGDKYNGAFDRPVPLSALQGFPILMLEGMSASRRYIDAYLKRKNVTLKPQIELGSLDLLIEFAANNLGIAVVTKEFLGGAVASRRVHVVRLEDEIPSRSVAMIWKKGVPLSLAGSEFAKILRLL